jgi:hypothetical protein
MYERARRTIETSCGFKSLPYLRWATIAFLLIASLVASYSAFKDCGMPLSAIGTIVFAGSLVLFLGTDSILYVRYLSYSSPREVLPLARTIDPQIGRAISDAEKYVKTLEAEALKAEIESQAKEILSDFQTRPPYPRIATALFMRTISNFLITILCFAILTIGLMYMDKYCRTGVPTYGHDCSQMGNFGSVLLHSSYYHSVVFQSLGDGAHAPQTISAQAIATIETLFAFFYLILILGGIYSTAAIVRDNLTPSVFRESLVIYLNVLCADKRPQGKDDIAELEQ